MPRYIRNTHTMKAAPVTDEDAFRAANKNGKFVYFEASGDAPEDPPDTQLHADIDPAVDKKTKK